MQTMSGTERNSSGNPDLWCLYTLPLVEVWNYLMKSFIYEYTACMERYNDVTLKKKG